MPGVIWWMLVLLAFVVLGFVAVVQVKRWVSKPDEGSAGTGFTLSDLRALHRSGKMSAEEFEKAKAIIVDAAQRAAKREAEEKAAKQKGNSPRDRLAS